MDIKRDIDLHAKEVRFKSLNRIVIKIGSALLIDGNTGKISSDWLSSIAADVAKLKEQGKHLVKLDQWYASSKTCHCCGHKMEEISLSVRKWDCPSCGTTDIDRDLNAALNIRDKGILELKAAGQSFLLMEAA